MTNQDFSDLSFADNADPRAPLALVLDCSDSMTERRPGQERSPLDALNGGLDTLVTELHRDPLAKRRVEVSVIAFGTSVNEPTPFATVDELVLPTLTPMGTTNMGEAVVRALDALEERKRTYKANGVAYYRPIVILLTDGLATDDVRIAAARVKEAEESKRVSFFAVGIDGADLDSLSRLSPRAPLMLKGLKFDEFFVWLSASQSAVSASQPGDRVALPSPAGWAEI